MPNPWYVPGWSAQQPYPGYDDVVITGPSFLPADIKLVTITATYATITGFRGGGSVKFTCVDTVLDAGSTTVILPDTIVGLVRQGALSVNIPSGFTYKVKELLPGGRKFSVTIPAATTGTMDINTLMTTLAA